MVYDNQIEIDITFSCSSRAILLLSWVAQPRLSPYRLLLHLIPLDQCDSLAARDLVSLGEPDTYELLDTSSWACGFPSMLLVVGLLEVVMRYFSQISPLVCCVRIIRSSIIDWIGNKITQMYLPSVTTAQSLWLHAALFIQALKSMFSHASQPPKLLLSQGT